MAAAVADAFVSKEPVPIAFAAGTSAPPELTIADDATTSAAVSCDFTNMVSFVHLTSPLSGLQREVHAGVGGVEEEAGGAGAGGHQGE